MPTITATQARSTLDTLIDEISVSHEPVLITGRHHNAVLLSETEWRSIRETLYLLSVPGMQESLHEGMLTPLDACSDEVEW